MRPFVQSTWLRCVRCCSGYIHSLCLEITNRTVEFLANVSVELLVTAFRLSFIPNRKFYYSWDAPPFDRIGMTASYLVYSSTTVTKYSKPLTNIVFIFPLTLACSLPISGESVRLPPICVWIFPLVQSSHYALCKTGFESIPALSCCSINPTPAACPSLRSKIFMEKTSFMTFFLSDTSISSSNWLESLSKFLLVDVMSSQSNFVSVDNSFSKSVQGFCTVGRVNVFLKITSTCANVALFLRHKTFFVLLLPYLSLSGI